MKLSYYDIKEQVIKLAKGVIKTIIIEKPVTIQMPNTFDGMVLGIKKLAKGWKLKDGQISCADGYCIMGALARMIEPDIDKFPSGSATVLHALQNPESDAAKEKKSKSASLPTYKLVDRLIAANDGVISDAQSCRDRITMLRLLGIKVRGNACEHCGKVHA